MKKKLTVLTLYSKEGASSNYRAFIFKDKLEEQFDVNWFSFWNKKYSLTYMHHKKNICFKYSFLTFFLLLKDFGNFILLFQNQIFYLFKKQSFQN